jgi:hypothetical protein
VLSDSVISSGVRTSGAGGVFLKQGGAQGEGDEGAVLLPFFVVEWFLLLLNRGWCCRVHGV